MLNVVLYEPEIPPNTGNLIRLCANSGAALHLIEPLGFSLEEKALRRAGLDYRESARVRCWRSLEDCLDALGPLERGAFDTDHALQINDLDAIPTTATDATAEGATERETAERPRLWATTSAGDLFHTVPRYRAGDLLLFGPESRGLPPAVLGDRRVAARLRVPMQPGSRSLNLSNAVSIVLYEAWRQLGFDGAVRTSRPDGTGS